MQTNKIYFEEPLKKRDYSILFKLFLLGYDKWRSAQGRQVRFHSETMSKDIAKMWVGKIALSPDVQIVQEGSKVAFSFLNIQF